ncbi:BURP domain - like 10 [Theobroma cacao]|nr:BURP domain - like 9 [Theobroma cacao]WRX34280.1 BURP domain - like 10 [Theobroma cacao]
MEMEPLARNSKYIYGTQLRNSKDTFVDSNLNRELKLDNTAINETIYFFQKDLRPGKMVNLPLLIKTKDMTPFFPFQVAKSIPFRVTTESREVDSVNETIKGCERVAINGEEKYCATSLESFVDLGVSKLGKNIQLLSTELGKETENPFFTIRKGVQNMGEKELYPRAVYLCHAIHKTEVYKVPLVGIDGTKADAVAVCHKDISGWNPMHSALQILKGKPGTVPICHFLMRDTLAWVSKVNR